MALYDRSLDNRGEDVSLNRLFDVFSHQYRRRVLDVLADAPGYEEELTPVELHREGVDFASFKTELVHIHLPMLAEAGYIEWDRKRNTIRHGPKFDEIAPIVELMDQHQDALPGDWP